MDTRIGDVNDTRVVDILDIIYLIEALYVNGPDPVPFEELGDVNCSGVINLIDITALIGYLYKGGPKPSCLEN
ncbi:MAG: dockerin type I domain-containing protein [Candidatus Zixiibacteriota bacterium]